MRILFFTTLLLFGTFLPLGGIQDDPGPMAIIVDDGAPI